MAMIGRWREGRGFSAIHVTHFSVSYIWRQHLQPASTPNISRAARRHHSYSADAIKTIDYSYAQRDLLPARAATTPGQHIPRFVEVTSMAQIISDDARRSEASARCRHFAHMKLTLRLRVDSDTSFGAYITSHGPARHRDDFTAAAPEYTKRPT